MSTDHPCYTLIAKDPQAAKQYSEKQLKSDLEGTNIPAKTAALKEVIRCIANGERMKDLLMTVIRFVMPCQNHAIKKLLLIFWEIVPKYGPDGKLLHEMILVCDAYRKDLQHPNEYIRGCTLRFLCKLKEPELLEPLIPTIKQCLEHRHSYVRRNAVLAIFTIYKNYEFLFPDAPNMILQYLEQEQDASCKRNAFMMLTHANQSMALEYLATCLDDVPDFDEILQLVIVELIYKVCHSNPAERARFIRCIYGLLQSKSPSVRYEAAGTLVTLSSAPTAIKAVASCYIDLIMKESDNNVKLIVMDRLISLRTSNERIMQDMVMDIVHILSSSDLELRTKALDFVSDLVSTRTVDELTTLLIKETLRACTTSAASNVTTGKDQSTATANSSDDSKYHFALVHTIYEIAMRFPTILPAVIPTLCEVITYDEIGDSNASAEVCRFLRESIKRHNQSKSLILEQLTQVFTNITGRETLRHILWIFGEFASTKDEINSFMNLVRQSIGELPLVDNEIRRLAIASGEVADTADAAGIDKNNSKHQDAKSAPRVTADGSYASQSVFNIKDAKVSKDTVQRPILQAAFFDAEYLPGVILAVALVKIFPRYQKIVREEGSHGQSEQKENVFAAECMLILSSLLHLSRSNLLEHHVNPDLIDRIWKCFRLFLDRNDAVLESFNRICDEKLDEMLTSIESERRNLAQTRRSGHNAQRLTQERERNRADAPVRFNFLAGTTGRMAGDQLLDVFDMTLNQALGGAQLGPDGKPLGDAFATSKLSKVHQLTGFSDPVYAEAYVNINQFDIVLDILIVNQTDDTLQNLNVELSTMGDFKLVERPSPIILAPSDFTNIKANIKVSSTENGMIFGNIVYDVRGSSGECTFIVLNEIHIDILEYIVPAQCTPTEYRQMWSDFEWENKVTVNTQIANLHLYLAHVLRSTNFQCLTPKEAMAGDCDYLCATLYAKSIFGEHVLANLCLEKQGPTQPVTGHIRIRAKTQGMAVTMGDKISACQKKSPASELMKEYECSDSPALISSGPEKSHAESVNGMPELDRSSAFPLVDCTA